MESGLRAGEASSAEITSAVSWGSIAAGAITAAAVSLALVALGVGLGLSAVSPWTDTGVSASTFKVTAGVYLVLVAVMSSAIGGYLSARLRTKWVGIHTNEAFFRDTAHGFVAWAFATIISATVLRDGDNPPRWRSGVCDRINRPSCIKLKSCPSLCGPVI